MSVLKFISIFGGADRGDLPPHPAHPPSQSKLTNWLPQGIYIYLYIYVYGGVYLVSVNTNMNRGTGLTFSFSPLSGPVGPRGAHEGPAHQGPAH